MFFPSPENIKHKHQAPPTLEDSITLTIDACRTALTGPPFHGPLRLFLDESCFKSGCFQK